MPDSRRSLIRWMGPLMAGVALLLLLGLSAKVYSQGTHGEMLDLMGSAARGPHVRGFALSLLFREILPLYVGMALVLWALASAWAMLPICLGRPWHTSWRATDGFLAALGLLGLVHVVLWWLVPTTLMLLPLIARLPFWAGLSLLTLLSLAPLLRVLRRSGASARAQLLSLAGWAGLAWAGAMLPLWLAAPGAARPIPGARSTKVLMLSVDGLRADTPEVDALAGCHYPAAYTPLPATRLCFSMLWGGDPTHYSLGHVFPSTEEFVGKVDFDLLNEARKRGWKSRFYIDDGGTIGLAGRTEAFDEVGMPARGWENFVNSNLGGYVPLYGSWLDVLRIFPCTTPWSRADAGVRAALEEGRGADWVMFHSCLSHIPIYLDREELAEFPRWWQLQPRQFAMRLSYASALDGNLASRDAAVDTLKVYRVRMNRILRAWAPIWNALGADPNYGAATRVFFSDHGERFYHVTEGFRLTGLHGFDLDPWELRVPFVVAGPGFKDGRADAAKAVSLLELRDAIGRYATAGRPPAPSDFGGWPFAPSRYHTIATDWLRPSDRKYKELSPEELAANTIIGPEGLWMMTYAKPAEARSAEAAVAEAHGEDLTVYKPLASGGAEKLSYQGFELKAKKDIPEDEFLREKARIDGLFCKPWKP